MLIKITTGISTTKKSAQSKKCRLLSKVASHELNFKIALAIRSADSLLASVLTDDEIISTWNNRSKSTSSRLSNSNRISIEVEVDELIEELINNSESGILTDDELDQLSEADLSSDY
jgi:hypothetical protein